MVKAWMSYLEPELVHRWPWLHSKIALFSARPHAQSKGSRVGNDRFSLYPLHCSHPARMKNTVQTHPLILLWIRPAAVQEPDRAISQPVTSFQCWNEQQEPNAEKRTIQTKMKILSFFSHPHVFPNSYDFLSSLELKRRSSEEQFKSCFFPYI